MPISSMSLSHGSAARLGSAAAVALAWCRVVLRGAAVVACATVGLGIYCKPRHLRGDAEE